jgi:hypothetical protein
MPDITVQRHGDRWAVLEAGSESATKEFETREAAELEARHLAAGGEITVTEDDPTGLPAEPPDRVDAGTVPRQPSTAHAGSAEGLARSIDAGL